MTKDNTNKMMTKIIPTDIAAKMKYITCPYLDRFQNFLKDNKIFKIFGLFSKIFPRIIQNRFHFSLCRMGFSLFFYFQKLKKTLISKICSRHPTWAPKVGFFIGQLGREICFWIVSPVL